MKNKIKNGIFIFFFIVLLLPAVDDRLHIIRSCPPVGHQLLAARPDFSLKKWWDGLYQEKMNRHIQDSFAAKGDLIRLVSQLDYSLFGKIHGAIIGKNDYLYFEGYAASYFGQDFIGNKKIQEILYKVKKIQDTLERQGKLLVVVYTPSKEFMYPENIPEYLNTGRGVTNAETFARTGDSLGINQLDFNSWFRSIKDTSREALYSKLGIHWTVYASYLAGDSLIRYIERRRNLSMPHMIIEKIERSDRPRYGDDDMGQMQNLIYPLTRQTLAYPVAKYTSVNNTKPKAIYLGDSYLFIWMHQMVFSNINSNWEVWYYFKGLYDERSMDGGGKPGGIGDYDWFRALNNTDYLVICYTTDNLPNLGDGFIEEAYNRYYPAK